MNTRTLFSLRLLALCLSLVLPISCARELKDDSVTSTPPTVAAGASPVSQTPAPSISPATLTPAPVSPSEPTATPTEPAAGGAGSAPRTHTVERGDTLLSLAREYNVPMAAIQLENEMGDSTVVQVGQELAIPPQSGWEGASAFWVVHVVREGETLVGIAKVYGLKAANLKAVNGITDADLIRVGQELVLPLDGPAATLAPPPTDTPVPVPTPTPVPTVSASDSDTPNPPNAPSATAAPAAPPPADVAAWPRETVRLINQVRAQHGLEPLVYNETLARAAQAHANDCSQRGWCSHTGSDGSNIKTRILRVGYDPASWAECWAQRKTPRGAVDIWMDEVPPNDPHRRTLLTTWLSEIGVGVAEAGWGYYYFIADFGRP